jgi:transcription elongation factor Elf1
MGQQHLARTKADPARQIVVKSVKICGICGRIFSFTNAKSAPSVDAYPLDHYAIGKNGDAPGTVPGASQEE